VIAIAEENAAEIANGMPTPIKPPRMTHTARSDGIGRHVHASDPTSPPAATAETNLPKACCGSDRGEHPIPDHRPGPVEEGS
jgi:hypothetical protein